MPGKAQELAKLRADLEAAEKKKLAKPSSTQASGSSKRTGSRKSNEPAPQKTTIHKFFSAVPKQQR